MITLRPYQAEAARAILHSVTNRLGLTFTVEMARQSGKNELSAWLETALLTRNILAGGTGIKTAPTFRPQILNSIDRLRAHLNAAGFDGLYRSSEGFMVWLGKARWQFFSAGPDSHIVGATAHLLLEVDEAQDVGADKYNKELRPFASTTNATTVLYGTAWDDTTLLEQTKQTNLALEADDGVRRHFEYDWHHCAQANPDYARYVDAERERLGSNHPLFTTQYDLRPLAGGGRLLTKAHLEQLQGNHPREHSRTAGVLYVAGLDVAGEAAPADLLARGHDETVLTIARVTHQDGHHRPLPKISVVSVTRWRGTPHSTLYDEIADLLEHTWGVRIVAVDATAMGEAAAILLARRLGDHRVIPYRFTQASKSELGYGLQAAVNTNRFALWTADGSEEHREALRQLALCRAVYKPNRAMQWFLAPEDGHDDIVSSLALLVEAANNATPAVARGIIRS
jgi:hypothetical protein